MDEAKIRVSNPPHKFDDKGKVVLPSPAELKELKGDDARIPGYKAELGDVRVNQIVQVVLVRKKGFPKPAAKPDPKAPKIKDGGDPAALANDTSEYAPKVSMLVIVMEAPRQ